MPHDQGAAYVLHLQSFLSAATESLYVIYEPLAPVRLLQDIRERGIEWIAIDHDSYVAMGCNMLAVRPGVVVMVDGVPAVRRPWSSAASRCTSTTAAISLKGDGGPTCLTPPLLRYGLASLELAGTRCRRASRSGRSSSSAMATAAMRAVARICSTYSVQGGRAAGGPPSRPTSRCRARRPDRR